MSATIRPFEQSLPMALLRAREAAMRQFRPALRAHDLTDQQWRVLRALTTAEQAMTVGEVAAATFLLGPSLTRILSNLGGRGLVERTVPEHDQRQGVISLTESGKALVAEIAPGSEATYDAIEAAFGPDRMALLMNLLTDLADLTPGSAHRTDNDAGRNSNTDTGRGKNTDIETNTNGGMGQNENHARASRAGERS